MRLLNEPIAIILEENMHSVYVSDTCPLNVTVGEKELAKFCFWNDEKVENTACVYSTIVEMLIPSVFQTSVEVQYLKFTIIHKN